MGQTVSPWVSVSKPFKRSCTLCGIYIQKKKKKITQWYCWLGKRKKNKKNKIIHATLHVPQLHMNSRESERLPLITQKGKKKINCLFHAVCKVQLHRSARAEQSALSALETSHELPDTSNKQPHTARSLRQYWLGEKKNRERNEVMHSKSSRAFIVVQDKRSLISVVAHVLSLRPTVWRLQQGRRS